jgi:hypothetical protein
VVTAPDQTASVSTPAFDNAQSSIQIIDPVVVVTPILASTTTSLEGVLKNLEGFMKMADLVAEACIDHLVIYTGEDIMIDAISTTDSSVGQIGVGCSFRGV